MAVMALVLVAKVFAMMFVWLLTLLIPYQCSQISKRVATTQKERSTTGRPGKQVA